MKTLPLAAAAIAIHIALGLLTLHSGPTGLDRFAFDVLDPLVTQDLREFARVFTDLGSFPVVAIPAVAAAIYAAGAGRKEQAIALLVGVLAVVLLTSVAKEIWDRPRPSGRFYDPGGFSFPSGHSAQSITWIAAARVLDVRWVQVAAAALAVTIGASRLYLHVHYLTDVLGGFALGVAVLAPVLARTR